MPSTDTGWMRVRAILPFKGWGGRWVGIGDTDDLPERTARALMRNGEAELVKKLAESSGEADDHTEHRIASEPENRTDPPPTTPPRKRKKRKRSTSKKSKE